MTSPRTDAPATSDADPIVSAVERVLSEWERASLDPEGAGVRRGMALEIRLAMRRAAR